MIALRTFGLDGNGSATSPFVSIATPVGVRDGDLVLVGLSVPGTVTITPPDDSWHLIGTTDPRGTVYVACYWKEAANEGARWIFALSSSTRAVGAALVYGGADTWNPIEAFALASTPSPDDMNVASIAAAENNEELVVFVGAASAGTYTPAADWAEVEAKSQTGISLSAQRLQLVQAQTVPAFTVPFNVNVDGASLILAVRPGVGTLSIGDVRERIVAALPPGADRVYDLEPGGDYYKYYQVAASVLKPYAFDLVDLARREVYPERSRYKLPDWERVFGLETTRIARLGSILQRQAQVLSSWREAAGASSTIAEVQAIVGVLLGYADPIQLEVLECSRAALTAAHTYALAPDTVAPSPGEYSKTVTVLDTGRISRAGVTLNLNLTFPALEDLVVRLTLPDSSYREWTLGTGSVTTRDYVLRLGPLEDARPVAGVYQVDITSSAAAGTVHSASIFVEGIGRGASGGEGLGRSIFKWGVVADPALEGAVSISERRAAYAALQRIKQSHTQAHLLIGNAISGGSPCFIPGLAIPNACVPCVPTATIRASGTIDFTGPLGGTVVPDYDLKEIVIDDGVNPVRTFYLDFFGIPPIAGKFAIDTSGATDEHQYALAVEAGLNQSDPMSGDPVLSNMTIAIDEPTAGKIVNLTNNTAGDEYNVPITTTLNLGLTGIVITGMSGGA